MTNNPGRLHLNIRKATSYDIRLHGRKIIETEFSLASIFSAAISLLYAFYPGLSLASRSYSLFWLGYLSNFLTILAIAVGLARQGVTRERGREWSPTETSELRRWTILIGVVLVVPYATMILAAIQSLQGDTR